MSSSSTETIILRQSLLLNPELTNSARPVGQPASGILFSLLAQQPGYRPPQAAFWHRCWEFNLKASSFAGKHDQWGHFSSPCSAIYRKEYWLKLNADSL